MAMQILDYGIVVDARERNYNNFHDCSSQDIAYEEDRQDLGNNGGIGGLMACLCYYYQKIISIHSTVPT
jgi:hypothetical protein